MEGKIKRLIRGKGFGFITAQDGTNVFFHRSRLQRISFDTLKEGDRVKFDLERGVKGLRAVRVRPIRG